MTATAELQTLTRTLKDGTVLTLSFTDRSICVHAGDKLISFMGGGVLHFAFIAFEATTTTDKEEYEALYSQARLDTPKPVKTNDHRGEKSYVYKGKTIYTRTVSGGTRYPGGKSKGYTAVFIDGHRAKAGSLKEAVTIIDQA